MSVQPEDWLALLERIRKGDRVALVHVTRLISAYLHRFGAYEFRDSCDDIIQEVLLKLLRSAREGAIRDPQAFPAFAGKVTYFTYVDWIRKNKPSAAVPLESDVDPPRNPDRRKDIDLMIDLDRKLAELPPEQSEVLKSIYLEGLSYQEAARRLGIPLGTLKRRQTQGLKSLRERMGIDKKSKRRGVTIQPSDPIDDEETAPYQG
jgi:RNA polymerase sigma factor (sigma-70 family)